MAKAYSNISHEALSIPTWLTHIAIKAEEVATLYNTTIGRNKQKYQIDKQPNQRNWLHPADIVSVNNTNDDVNEQLT